MLSLKNLWRRGMGSGDVYRPPERDEHMVACDTLMSELDFHIKELDRYRVEQEQEERRLKTGVDYSWLMETQPRASFEIPQMERLELEELCYKATGAECTQIIALFRDALSRDPRLEDLPYIMRSCVKKVLDERPTQESLSEWVWRRSTSLANFSSISGLRLKPSGKIVPASSLELEDIEMQREQLNDDSDGASGSKPSTVAAERSRAMSMPNFTVRQEGGAYPV